MTTSSKLIDAVVAKLSGYSALKNVTIVNEFPAIKRDIPLSQPTVSVGVDRLSVALAEGYTKLAIDASPATVRIKLTVCVPKSMTGLDCYGILDGIVAAFNDLALFFNIIGIESGELKYSSSLGVLVLPLTVTFDAGNAFAKS